MVYIVYGSQGSDIVSFMTETRMTLNNLGVLMWMYMLEYDWIFMVEW